MGIITGLGWLFSGVTKFVPGLHRLAFYAVALVSVVGMASGYAWHVGSEGKGAAVAREAAACEVRIANIQTAAERTISDIVTSVDEAGTSSKDVTEYCKQHPGLCRGAK